MISALPSFPVLAAAKGVNGLVGKASQGVIYNVTVTNYSGSLAYLVISDSPTVRSDFTQQVGISVAVPLGSSVLLDGHFGANGQAFKTGISVALSTTGNGVFAAASGTGFDIQIDGA